MFANFVVIVILVLTHRPGREPKLHKNPLSAYIPTGVIFILVQGVSYILVKGVNFAWRKGSTRTGFSSKGVVWYFECPHTKRRCRKLYLIGKYFLHRKAFNGCMYDIQTKSKDERAQTKMINTVFRTDDLYNQLYGRYFKQSYAGKPTKKYIRLMKKIQQAENVPAHEIERILLPKRYR